MSDWIKVYFSPFKIIVPRLYIGKIAIGVPYFHPRRWIKNKEKDGYLKAVPRKIGFDFVRLGWKTKWEDTDYRYEWSPIWSFVFFKWQLAIIFVPIEPDHYWTCWLYYHKNTDKSKTTRERIVEARRDFPCIWSLLRRGEETQTVDYWNIILKKKWI